MFLNIVNLNEIKSQRKTSLFIRTELETRASIATREYTNRKFTTKIKYYESMRHLNID